LSNEHRAIASSPDTGDVASGVANPAAARVLLRKAFWLLALVLWVVAVRYRSFDLSVSDADESLFILIGQSWLAGHLPYVAIWDVKPPGLFLLYAAAQWLIGPGILAARVMTAAAVFAGSLALYNFSRKHLEGGWVAPAAAILYPPYTTILFGLRSLPETLLAPFVIQALSLALAERNRRSDGAGWRVPLSGLLLGCAVMIKQTAGLESLLAAGLIGIRLRDRGPPIIACRPVAEFAAAGALPAVWFLAYFALSGVDSTYYLTPFLGVVHRLRGDGFSFAAGLFQFLPGCKPILPLLAGGLLLLAERHRLRRAPDASAIRAIYLWMAASAAGVLAMRSMYHRYFVPLIPSLLLGSLRVLELWEARLDGRRRLAVFSAALLAFAAYPFFWSAISGVSEEAFSHPPLAVVHAMYKAGLRPQDALYVVDEDMTIYLFAHANFATRYLDPQHLVCNFTLPGTTANAEIRRIMANRPRFVVVSHSRRRMVCERPDRVAIVDSFLARDYRLLTTVSQHGESVDIYRLQRRRRQRPRTLAEPDRAAAFVP
jgi:4-amino-4-deoxy-L-arabinose transferase-like glycosyltransferase